MRLPVPSVIVVGAGPAGSIAALLLARAGWRVHLVEQHRFPRDKVCGECLSALGIEVLARSGLDAVVRGWGAIPLRYTRLHAATGESVTLPLPREMWGISRHVLDQVLLLEAARAGATVLQPARCEGIERADGRSVVRLRDLVTNHVTEHQPDWVIVADISLFEGYTFLTARRCARGWLAEQDRAQEGRAHDRTLASQQRGRCALQKPLG